MGMLSNLQEWGKKMQQKKPPLTEATKTSDGIAD